MTSKTAYKPITLVQSDWSRFMTEHGLAEKCGVPRSGFGHMILKELADNAADIGGGEIFVDGHMVNIRDGGDGIDATEVPKLFNIKRDLTSSKHWRRAQRGALGNGLRAVMGALYVLGGKLTVSSRGVSTTVAVDDNGDTVVLAQSPSTVTTGTEVSLDVNGFVRGQDFFQAALPLIPGNAFSGSVMDGKPSPKWFDTVAIEDLLRSASGYTVGEFVGQFATRYQPQTSDAPASSADPAELLRGMAAHATAEPKLRALGKDALTSVDRHSNGYHRVDGVSTVGGATMPYIIEVWASASQTKGAQRVNDVLIVNRSVALTSAQISVGDKGRLRAGDWVLGSSLRDKYTLRNTVDFEFWVSITTPFMPILSSGKKPDLAEFATDILIATGKAGRQAQNEIKRRTVTGVSAKDAVWSLMADAYERVSEGGRYWANARQLMYAMRPDILSMTGKTTVDDRYITATLIPEYVNENADQTKNWKIAYDARGHFVEPHTGRQVQLGTIAVGSYTQERYVVSSPVDGNLLAVPPEHRLRGVLFVEKEGFQQNIEESGLLEMYDLALASTKGMSNVAARELIDYLASKVDDLTLFTLCDFDIAGVTIEDTLVKSGWRYTYQNKVRHVSLAVDWELAQQMHEEGLSEPSGRDNAKSYRDKLAEAGLELEAVDFLTTEGDDGKGLRVELNAILPAALLEIIDNGVGAHIGQKVIPTDLGGYYRELVIRERLRRAEAALRSQQPPKVPDGLAGIVRAMMDDDPTLSWDAALAQHIEGVAVGELA